MSLLKHYASRHPIGYSRSKGRSNYYALSPKTSGTIISASSSQQNNNSFHSSIYHNDLANNTPQHQLLSTRSIISANDLHSNHNINDNFHNTTNKNHNNANDYNNNNTQSKSSRVTHLGKASLALLLSGLLFGSSHNKNSTEVNAKEEKEKEEAPFYSVAVKDIDGKEVSFQQYRGKVLSMVFLSYWIRP